MNFATFAIDGPGVIEPKWISESRGRFSETFREGCYGDNGRHAFVQDNQPISAARGTIRGSYFRLQSVGPRKLGRCLKGAIPGLATDVKRSSPTLGPHAPAELTAHNDHQVRNLIGFAHGETMRAISVEDKPRHPKSKSGVTVLYSCYSTVVIIAKGLQPPTCGELEITDVSRASPGRGELSGKLIGRSYAWLDVGTPDSFLEAEVCTHA